MLNKTMIAKSGSYEIIKQKYLMIVFVMCIINFYILQINLYTVTYVLNIHVWFDLFNVSFICTYNLIAI